MLSIHAAAITDAARKRGTYPVAVMAVAAHAHSDVYRVLLYNDTADTYAVTTVTCMHKGPHDPSPHGAVYTLDLEGLPDGTNGDAARRQWAEHCIAGLVD